MMTVQMLLVIGSFHLYLVSVTLATRVTLMPGFTLPYGFNIPYFTFPTEPATSHAAVGRPDCSRIHVRRSQDYLSQQYGTPHQISDRFILDNIHTDFSSLIRKVIYGNISQTLPASMEVDHHCRFDISRSSHSELDLLKRLYEKGYQICSLCDGYDSGDGTCTIVGVCNPGSVCSRGHNLGYKSSLTGLAAAFQPPAVTHGCCNRKNKGCSSHNYLVRDGKNIPKVNYSMAVCSSPLCNTDSKLQSLRDRTLDYICTYVTSPNLLQSHGDGKWAHWESWSWCSTSCGPGFHHRRRTCTNPAPAHNGAVCTGPRTQTATCTLKLCPVDGHWTDWTHWSSCSVSCGAGRQKRGRSCTNPVPVHNGEICAGANSQYRSCNRPACAVDGQWGHWSHFSGCSVTCGKGHVTKSRQCDSPAPSHGGRTCPGSNTQTQTCSGKVCPVDGQWTEWTLWSSCSVTCLTGTQSRTRLCSNPAPAYGGANCPGNHTESVYCDRGVCPTWSQWFHGDCSVTCGLGSRPKFRHCGSGHDEDCPGKPFATESCRENPCPVDGQWGAWLTWGSCSVTCARGTQLRRRHCNNPPPSNGGVNCNGQTEQETHCNTQPCPAWGDWFAVSACSVTCGEGSQQIKRNCTSGYDADCIGSPYDERTCSQPSC